MIIARGDLQLTLRQITDFAPTALAIADFA
jgi:hypothetical protein